MYGNTDSNMNLPLGFAFILLFRGSNVNRENYIYWVQTFIDNVGLTEMAVNITMLESLFHVTKIVVYLN